MRAKTLVVALAAMCCLAWAGEEAVIRQNTAVRAESPTIGNREPAIGDGSDAIAIPRMLSYQGKLTDASGNPVPNGNYTVVFRLYTTPTGPTSYWDETQTVRCSLGLFNVRLGSVRPIDSFPQAGACYLGVKVGADPEMVPRMQLVSAGYAYLSGKSDTANYARAALPIGAATGDLAEAYPSPRVDGLQGRSLAPTAPSDGQVLKWFASPGAWVPANDEVGSGGDNAWVRGTPDSVLYTIRPLGISRAGAENALFGSYRWTHVNLGGACTTGTSGQDYGSCAVTGGWRNAASGELGFVGGGEQNRASGLRSVVGGGFSNKASNAHTFVGGGLGNAASGDYSAVDGGWDNLASGDGAMVGGGLRNQATNWCATVAGGDNNVAAMDQATVGGGVLNAALGRKSTVAGGESDTARGVYAGVLSGNRNRAGDEPDDTAATVAGGRDNSAWGECAFVGGGADNTAESRCPTVSGGQRNIAGGVALDDDAAVGGGFFNRAPAWRSAICGGGRNKALADAGVVVGGWDNLVDVHWSGTIGGGRYNTAYNASYATVAGGDSNIADEGGYSTVGGGLANRAGFSCATVPGGWRDTVLSAWGFATGAHSKVGSHENSAAFTGSHTTASNQVRAQAFSTGTGVFTVDHPADPAGKMLNQYAIGSPELVLLFRGTARLDAQGKAEVTLPRYFAQVSRNPMVELTGVGTWDVYVAEEVTGNQFVIGGKPGTEVFWTVTSERVDQSAELARRLTPVEQPKTGELVGHSLDDDGLLGSLQQLEQIGQGDRLAFRTSEGRQRYEQMKQQSSRDR